MNIDNYPSGAFNDPNAPWNEPEQELFVCWSCGKEAEEGGLTEVVSKDGNSELLGDCCIDDFIILMILLKEMHKMNDKQITAKSMESLQETYSRGAYIKVQKLITEHECTEIYQVEGLLYGLIMGEENE